MRYAVGYMNFYDNELIIEIVEASSPKEALWNHSHLNKGDWKDNVPDNLETLKELFFDGDSLIEVVEIPE